MKLKGEIGERLNKTFQSHLHLWNTRTPLELLTFSQKAFIDADFKFGGDWKANHAMSIKKMKRNPKLEAEPTSFTKKKNLNL